MKSTFPMSAPAPRRADELRPHTLAELMSDSAIYRRTQRGQRALLRADDATTSPALRLLARFNGYTDLRRLIELAPAESVGMARALGELFDEGLIEMVDLSM